MNILYLAHRIPYPPNKGDKLRAFRQIEHLARRHRVWCACFIDDPRDFRQVQDLRFYCNDVGAVEIKPIWARARGLHSLAFGRTITEGYYASRKMCGLLALWEQRCRFDVVIAFSSSMAAYALQVTSPRRILDLCDLDSQKWTDYADHTSLQHCSRLRDRLLARLYRAEGRRLAAAELRWIDAFDAALLATDAEATPLRSMVAPRKLHVVGNGVDVHEGEPQDIPSFTSRKSGDSKKDCAKRPPVIGFVGVMDYFPNVDAVTWFANECWPTIRSQFPNATFRIVGRSPTSAVRRLANFPGIQVVGEVENIANELGGFDVSVAPLRIARGVQNKVLEAMAAAKPVILTANAAKGIAATAGQDYLIADCAGQFTTLACKLLANPALRSALGQSARQFVARHRCWEGELQKLETLVTEQSTRSLPADRTFLNPHLSHEPLIKPLEHPLTAFAEP